MPFSNDQSLHQKSCSNLIESFIELVSCLLQNAPYNLLNFALVFYIMETKKIIKNDQKCRFQLLTIKFILPVQPLKKPNFS